jgi:hypothetical protein
MNDQEHEQLIRRLTEMPFEEPPSHRAAMNRLFEGFFPVTQLFKLLSLLQGLNNIVQATVEELPQVAESVRLTPGAVTCRDSKTPGVQVFKEKRTLADLDEYHDLMACLQSVFSLRAKIQALHNAWDRTRNR